MSRSALLGSSLAKKYWMALTGLFLCVFLIAHLAGNLQLLDMSPAGQLKFNAYAKFMTTFPVVKIVSYLLYASILFHAFDGIILTIQNRKARPIKYAYEKANASSKWYSRQMALLGMLVLVFIVLHMKHFWYEMHWGPLGMDADGNKDLYTLVAAAFAQPLYVLVYVASMVVLAFHLMHGFQSAFQSMGLNHPKYMPIIKTVGIFFAVIAPLFFALIPVWMFVNASPVQ
ncbi:MAG: succinate dehydrogenase cytochrome b subunit [Flavobacteriales bacterium]|jgi:succinate dehydrogenase / fumarate reductase cytochrome b subunit|nr:succinate dehydrogenase cytochrome b subunit [Flavobacteriales bacterium]MBK6551988.1 succinate dehydrogenase cytochrome b subunit [Flavobacteriales bacterium]MBK6883370.1 succinate dehydrogenase cytochrome b subunit [Flavobacteriales bacterium]MBK7103015.1 succinate dehydrogenase cytochrome b subunit [Flavobacteriales bacterium]MBK7113884.1 succinate dehydrogenase cytochrome b subunit [Flavobacteriales bacterium]